MNHRTNRRQVIKLIAGAGIASTTGILTAAATSSITMAQAGDTQLVCNAHDVQVRTEPGLDTEVVGTLDADDVVNLIDIPADVDGLVWLNVAGGDLVESSGWVAAVYLDTPTDVDGWGVGLRAYVDTAYLNLRSEPGLDSEVLLVLPQFTRAIVSSAPVVVDDLVWNGVIFEYDNASGAGYVASDYLAEDVGLEAATVAGTPAASPDAAGAGTPATDLPEPAPVLEPEEVEADPSIEPAG